MTAIATTPSSEGLTLDDTTTTDEFTIGALCVPDMDGDTRLMWDSRNADEVDAARRHFDSLRSKGYAVYNATKKRGNAKGEVITTFDPSAERLVAVKPLVGG
jgi:hypothetical protein